MGFMDMLKDANKLRAQQQKLERELSAMKFEREAKKGDALVTVMTNGKMEVIGMKLSDEAMQLKPDDLSKLILQGISGAQADARNEASRKTMELLNQ
jgi:DNA-binding protein YbaB